MENDTVKLLRECDAGVKMAISSFEDIEDKVDSGKLRDMLNESKKQHSSLAGDISKRLFENNDSGKDPNPVAKGMSWMKTELKMGIDGSDKTVADLMTDGCNMGIKSLGRYLNQYKAADENSQSLARKLITIEADLVTGLREYL